MLCLPFGYVRSYVSARYFLLLPLLLLLLLFLLFSDDADKGLSAQRPQQRPQPWSYAILMKHLKSINENKKSPTKATNTHTRTHTQAHPLSSSTLPTIPMPIFRTTIDVEPEPELEPVPELLTLPLSTLVSVCPFVSLSLSFFVVVVDTPGPLLFHSPSSPPRN